MGLSVEQFVRNSSWEVCCTDSREDVEAALLSTAGGALSESKVSSNEFLCRRMHVGSDNIVDCISVNDLQGIWLFYHENWLTQPCFRKKVIIDALNFEYFSNNQRVKGRNWNSLRARFLKLKKQVKIMINPDDWSLTNLRYFLLTCEFPFPRIVGKS